MAYCDWDSKNELLTRYHDEEWGVPIHDDRKQFEYLMLEAMQAGLNWNMMLQKREIFRPCFDNFDYTRLAESSMIMTKTVRAAGESMRTIRPSADAGSRRRVSIILGRNHNSCTGKDLF